jgi:hypothetical protein
MLFLSTNSLADCEDIAVQIGAQLTHEDGTTYEDSTDKTLRIVALANVQKSTTPVDSFELYDLDVLLLRNESGKISNRLFRKSAFQSNALALSGITIDTARYQLAPQLRAFGIRANFASNSHSYSASYETINLFVFDGKVVKEVLSNLIMVENSGSGDFDFVDANDQCTGSIAETKRILAIAKTTSHGYADLLITENKMQSDSKLVKRECKTTPLYSTKLYTLHFNGDAYVIPKVLQYK